MFYWVECEHIYEFADIVAIRTADDEENKQDDQRFDIAVMYREK